MSAVSPVESAMNNINLLMMEVIKENIDFRTKQIGKDMVANGKEVAQKIKMLLDCFRMHTNTIESILRDTIELTDNIATSIQVDDAKSDYVHMSGNGILVYKDERFVEKPQPPKKKAIKTLNHTDQQRRTITYIQPYNSNLTAIHVNDLTFEDSFRYYNDGVYFCLGHRNYVRVPYVNIIDNKTTNKARSIRCRFGSKEACKRSGYCRQECFFAHDGDIMTKVGYPGRCGQIVDFGNPSTFNFGVSRIGIGDIRTMLMYGLNDLFVVMLWMEYHGIKNKVFENLDIA